MGYTLDTVYEIWDDQAGTRTAVGPDRDGLDLVELRRHADDGTCETRTAFLPAEALSIAAAMIKCAEDMIAREAAEKTKE